MRKSTVRRVMAPGRIAVLTWLLVILLAACGNYYHRGTLETHVPEPGYVPAGDGATVDRLVYLLTGWSHSTEAHTFGDGDAAVEEAIPLPAFLIERQGEYTLVDTGLAPSLATEPSRYLGKTVAWLAEGPLQRVVIDKNWPLPARLRQMGVDPAKVRRVVLTHAHFDHTGANRAFLDATFVLTPQLLDAGRHGALLGGYWSKDFPAEMKVDLTQFAGTPPFLTFTGSRDLFGDGSVVLVPLPGHDPGHTGVFVRTPKGPVLLLGDAAYSLRNITEMRLPGYLSDDAAEWDTLHRLKRLLEVAPEIRLVPSHDGQVFRSLPTAPESL